MKNVGQQGGAAGREDADGQRGLLDHRSEARHRYRLRYARLRYARLRYGRFLDVLAAAHRWVRLRVPALTGFSLTGYFS
jgi:hypothetical protein